MLLGITVKDVIRELDRTMGSYYSLDERVALAHHHMCHAVIAIGCSLASHDRRSKMVRDIDPAFDTMYEDWLNSADARFADVLLARRMHRTIAYCDYIYEPCVEIDISNAMVWIGDKR